MDAIARCTMLKCASNCEELLLRIKKNILRVQNCVFEENLIPLCGRHWYCGISWWYFNTWIYALLENLLGSRVFVSVSVCVCVEWMAVRVNIFTRNAILLDISF